VTAGFQQDLANAVECRVVVNEPLAAHTTYRIGGPAAALVEPASAAAVVRALRFCSERGIRWMALGLGSNVLVADTGFPGVVIRLGRGLDTIERGVGGDPTQWRVGAGVPTPRLARRTAQEGLAGLHRLVGVPGSVGGGVYVNAGAHGQDFASVVRSIDCVTASGEGLVLGAEDIPWGYRSSGLEQVIVLGATIGLTEREPRGLVDDVQQYLARRRAGTPFNEPCCGSVFRNPVPDRGSASVTRTAGQLIDAVGLKGFRIGGAVVSRKHANYIVNVGRASSADVMTVIHVVRERVMAEFGVELELEVHSVE
jgi:UDP-N-acetylmuramate dehydrogenase